ncbi:ImmA/IrrE family metallo-endopeptidase [Acetobacter sp. DmW_043]|uniref:ImmA/IrrE family metallo-endopeptidase n=1 Tax=Acetobacter sp. DmW_043 TaxID=1670658 RepID=UPI000A3A8DEF|nr:ImmA/IrrE family metallo-endopeptidase [Acetobacter sp. DmW_043]
MTPSRPRFGRIEALVAGLLQKAEVVSAPVPVEKLINSCGITVNVLDLKDISGLVVRDHGNIVIGINKSDGPQRRRFTMAHELGHALLHDGKEVHYDQNFKVDFRSHTSTLGTDIEEIEANFFAASILMPWQFLRSDPLLSELDVEDPASVKVLAARYKVSQHAMSIRLGNLAARGRL